jgi:type IV pilus biogenesis protein CpaD/CtpE
MRRAVRIGAGAALLAFLSGCAGPDPYEFPHTWRPTGANDANLAVMAVRPADLARGRGTGRADADVAAAAVDRLRTGHVKGLDTGGGSSGTAGVAGLAGN